MRLGEDASGCAMLGNGQAVVGGGDGHFRPGPLSQRIVAHDGAAAITPVPGGYFSEIEHAMQPRTTWWPWKIT